MSLLPVTLVECPRDAMQGWPRIIPTAQKKDYLNQLLKVGFDTLDCGSFVSAKAIPQMADTRELIPQLETGKSQSSLLAIIANLRGAEEAVQFSSIRYLGFPFSVSETFQQRNTNSTIAESLERVKAIQNSCVQHGKEMVVYLSMGFGNPYGDPYDEQIVVDWASQLQSLNIKILSLADTVGVASPDQVYRVTSHLVSKLPDVTIGVHLHSTPYTFAPKLEAAYAAGCRRFDGALLGIGGCPMADDHLVGNMNMIAMIDWFTAKGLDLGLDDNELGKAVAMAGDVFQS